MKAIVFDEFGDSSVLKLREVANPTPGTGEVLVDVAYAGVNPVDYKIREGHLGGLLPHELPIIPGWDAAGVISQVGEGVGGFAVGDRVFAYCRKPVVKMGAYAEKIVLEASAVAKMPKGLSFQSASTIPLVGLTAWQALFDFASLSSGQTVMIHGAAGGVGGLAIQFAKVRGAVVYASASAKNAGYLQELGVDHFIDYTRGNLNETLKGYEPGGFDVIFDCVGGETLANSYGLVKVGGALVSIVDTPDEAKMTERKLRGGFHFVSPSGEQLEEIGALIGEGLVKPLPVQVFPLAEAAKALDLSQERHVRGKLTLKVAP